MSDELVLVSLRKPLEVLLDEHPNVSFRCKLVETTCHQLGLSSVLSAPRKLNSISTIGEFLELLTDEHVRIRFMTHYVVLFEEGERCRQNHALALELPSTASWERICDLGLKKYGDAFLEGTTIVEIFDDNDRYNE